MSPDTLIHQREKEKNIIDVSCSKNRNKHFHTRYTFLWTVHSLVFCRHYDGKMKDLKKKLFIWLCEVLVAACRLSCSTVGVILVPPPKTEPTSRTLQGRFLITGPPGKPYEMSFDRQLWRIYHYLKIPVLP